jgi:hypothetical protein
VDTPPLPARPIHKILATSAIILYPLYNVECYVNNNHSIFWYNMKLL